MNAPALQSRMAEGVAMLLTLGLLTIPPAFLINHAVPTAYMDEEFHIRQVQHYCRGEFDVWDPMITTFPGLYIVSLVHVRALVPLGRILGFTSTVTEVCQPVVLRSLNILLGLVCALLFREIILHLDPKKRRDSAAVKAVVLSLYPLHWFFNFLYYTEMSSATAVVAMYLACLKHFYWSSALLGAVSVLLRQTNVVWVIFVLCIGVLEFIQNGPDWKGQKGLNNAQTSKLEKLAAEGGKGSVKPPLDKKLRNDGLRKRQASTEAEHSKSTVSEKNVQRFVNQGTFSEALALVGSSWRRRNEVVWNFGPLLSVVIAFVAFVFHNGSIVVGDKSSHKVSPHFAQLLYCGLLITGFQAAVYFSPQNLSRLVKVLKTSPGKLSVPCSIIAFVFVFISVRFFSSPHLYLLADNRHYTFYVWKDVLQRHWSTKYLFVPLYIFSWWSIIVMLGQRQKVLWVLAFCLAVAGVLVPTPLLEFRYYNVPFYFVYLHSWQKGAREKYTVALTALQFVCVNATTVYIFLYWPFAWPSEPGKLQRFLW